MFFFFYKIVCLRVDGKESLYEASVYQTKNDWSIKVREDKETQSTQVFRALNGVEIEELMPKITKQYSTEKKESTDLSKSSIFHGVRIGTSVLDFVKTIIDLVAI